MNIEKEIKNIKARNKRVEADKSWETSKTRKFVISILTYLIFVVFIWSAGLEKPFINAIIPSVAFILSTLTLPVLKKCWVNKFL
jgi:hypothetical protein